MQVRKLAVYAVGALCAGTAIAFDVGDPIYSGDTKGNTRIEVIYEKYDRDATLNYGEVTVVKPSGTVTTSVDDDTSEADINAYMARLSWLASESTAVYLDAGAVDEDDADGTPLIIGIGGRVTAFTQDKFQLSVFAAGHYVPSHDMSSTSFDPDHGSELASGEEEFYELSAGALLSGKFSLQKGTIFVPYGGLACSILRGDIDVDIAYPDVDNTVTSSADIEEDDLILAIVGASLVFHDNLSLRVEGRLIGDSSVSAALGASF